MTELDTAFAANTEFTEALTAFNDSLELARTGELPQTELEKLEQGIRDAQERYQAAIDLHEHVNPTHLTHGIALLCDHEVFSMGCYGDGHTDCDFQATLVCVGDSYEAQVHPRQP